MITIRAAAITIACICGLSAFAATAAFAQNAPAGDSWLSVRDVESRLSAAGYQLIEIERDDGEFEVKARNAQGQCRELHLNRATGEIVREESDDDCDGGGRRSSRS